MVKEAFILHLLYFMLDVRTALITQVNRRRLYFASGTVASFAMSPIDSYAKPELKWCSRCLLYIM